MPEQPAETMREGQNICMPPLVSIMLAAWNGERFIHDQIGSLLSQDYSNIEIVATDDCSTDATPLILDEYARKYPGSFRVLQNDRNAGFVGNFERGIRAASGDYIALSDQDDV